jgi:hypothetical protein
MMLGNQLPHLHNAGGPPEFDESAPARNEGTMQNEADALRHAIEEGNDFD